MAEALKYSRERSWLTRAYRKLFYVDLRSLAAMRICLGLVILADLISRGRDLVAHYTDLGVAPRDVLEAQYGLVCYFSVHYWASPYPGAVAGLFVLNALAALLLLLGWRTRLATVVCWYLLASLLIRNPLVAFAGDRTLQLVLFWSIFLPLGARWSMDRWLNPASHRIRNRYVSVAGLALLLQVCFIYWFAVGFKLLTDMWGEGDAVAAALGVDALVRPLGLWLGRYENVLPFLTAFVLNFELVGPFLPFIPKFTTPGRLTAVVAFGLLHLAFGLCFNLGLFPFMSFTAWVAFLPTPFWDWVEQRLGWTIEPGGSPVRPTRAANLLAAACLVLVVALNIRSLPPLTRWIPKSVEQLGTALRLTQSWGMFTTRIPHGWFVVPGHLADGREVDLLEGDDVVPWKRPPVVTAIYPGSRWIQFLHAFPRLDASPWWPSYAAYLCRDWNRRHKGGERLESLSIGYMFAQPGLDGAETLIHKELLSHTCEP